MICLPILTNKITINENFNPNNSIRVCIEDLKTIEIQSNVQIIDLNSMPIPLNQTLFISSDDIIDEKITKNHTLNSNSVDCSLFDHTGTEISVGFKIIDSNTVELNMSKVVIPIGMIWKIFLEV